MCGFVTLTMFLMLSSLSRRTKPSAIVIIKETCDNLVSSKD